MTITGKTFAALLRQPSRLLTILFLLFGFAVGITFRHGGNTAQNSKKPLAQQQSHALTRALSEAVNAAQYNLNEVNTANGEKSLEAVNPAQGMRASFTSQEIQVHSGSVCQTPWQLGLQLKRVGYGTQLRDVRPGVLSAQGNRVEIQRDTITEWYLNTPEGIEQGFTLNARPTTAPQSSSELRVVMELSSGWSVTTERDQQAITLRQGTASLRYDKLHTLDATGRELASRMEVNGNELALVVNDANAVWPITIDPTLTQQTQFVASNGASFDHFGSAVAISGDTAVVGVPDSDPSSKPNAGAVYVFVRTGSAWSQQAQLTASDAANNDSFGAAVAISGDTIVVGAYGDDNGFNSDQGSAYVFVRSGTTWSQQTKLTVGDGAANDWFGYSVAVSGDTVIVGAPLDDFGGTVNQGSAYVFVRGGAAWNQQQQLNATGTADSDNFGFAVALQGETGVVGAPAGDVSGNSDQGSAYVFVRSSTTWSQQQQLNASEGGSADLFGYAVALSGETVIVGAPRDDINANVDQGSAYVFVRSSTAWSQQTKLTASDGAGGDTFGNAIAISGEMAVIGAPANAVSGNLEQGSAYVFVRSSTTWSQQQQLLASDGTSNDNAGSAVAISGFTALVGTPNDDVNGNTDQGSTYVFSPTCPTMTLSPAMLANGTQNLLYPTTTIASSAGTAPLTYAIISGALPAGLTFSSSGVLAGTPTAAGTFNFTVKVTDANLCTGTQAYSLAIATCAPPVVSTEPVNQSSAVGSSASFIAAAIGTPPTVQWQVSTDGNTWSNLNGATNVTLNLTNLAITMQGNQYRAVFTNACGTATSAAATLTVNKLTPTVALNLSATSSTYGQSVILTASVNMINSVAPTGSITFKSGTTTIGTGTIANGQAAVSLSSLNAAAHSLTAEFSGDTNYVAITSSASVLTITKATLTVTAENNTKIYGAANPDLTATITGFVNSESASVVTGAAAITTTATAGSAVGAYTITAEAGTLAAANYNFTFVSATLTIGKATLTVTADNKSRKFGAANPELTVTITGFVNGDTVSAVNGAASLTTTAITSSGVGTYAITAALGTLTAINYDFTLVNGTLTITAQTLTITAQDKSRIYGAANPTLTVQYAGFVNGDTESVLTGAVEIATTATMGSNVGTYPITVRQGSLQAGNYALIFVDGTLTIGKAALNVTANDATRSYGSANPTLTGTLTGLQNNDRITASYATTATINSAVSTYPITPALSDPDSKLGNYQVTQTNGTLTITPAALTITAENKARIYGATNPALTTRITGFVNGETESALSGTLQLSTTATASSSVGDYPITVGGFTSTNYTINFVNGTLTITKATLTVTAENKTRIYGATNPDLTATITGFVNNETASVVSGAAEIITTAAVGSTVGEYPITVAHGTLAATNYDFTFTHAKLTIGKAMLTVTAVNKSRTYGTENPELTATITGFVNSDTTDAVTGTPALTTTATVNSGFGTYPITTTLGTLAATNYDFTLVNGTLTIAAQTLIVTAQDKSRIYGAANPTLTVQYSGFVNGDTESVVTGVPELTTTATTGSNVGAYPITVRQGTLQAGNYALIFVDGTLTIGKAALTVAANDATRSYGLANPTLTGTLTGVQNNDQITATYATTATVNNAVSGYPITSTLNDPDNKLANYQVTQRSGILAIMPAPLTVTAENKSRTYGVANPVLTASVTGLVNGETESVLSGTLQLSTTAMVSSSAGKYPITVSGYTSPNYAINYVSGTLVVSKAVLTVSAENKAKTYGAANPDLTTAITGFVNNETASVVSGAAEITTTATQTSGAGSYPITGALGTLAATNYEFVFVGGTLTIGKVALTVTAANKTKVFGAPLPELTYSITGFLNGDGANVVTGAPTAATTATAASKVGIYPIDLSRGTLSAESYDFNFVNAELTVSPATTAVTLVSNLPSSLFGQAVTFTAIVNAVAPGNGIPDGTITFKDGAKIIGTGTLTNGQAALMTSGLETGTHNLTAEYSGAANFIASGSSAVTHSVAKSPATVTLASSFDSVRYGQAVALNVTVSGGGATPTGNVRFLNGNTVLGTVALVNGAASLAINTLSVAMHTITAVYDGDTKNDSGTSRSFTLTVNKATQPLTIGSSANPVAWKQFVTLAASVNSAGDGLAAPTGTIVFKDGANVLGTAALSRLGRASLSTNALSPGAHSITAEFSGDSNYEAHTATAISQTISTGATAIRLTSSAKTTTVGQPVIFSAQLHSNAGTPTGQIELYDGTQLLGTETLNNGWGSWTVTSLNDGEHSLKAVYKGDAQFAASTSATLPHTVSLYCTWTLATNSAFFDLKGGTGFIPVDGRNDCYWNAFTNNQWITILDYGPEIGAVSFTVAPLTTGTSRKGTIFVAGQRVTILQTKAAVTVSGASYTREGLAPDAIASVFGEGMATITEPSQALPLPTTLGGTQVMITDSQGTEHVAKLFYVSPLQINYLVPTEVALGPALVTIQTPEGEITGGGMIEVTLITPGLFTANANGSGVAAAVVQRVLVDNSQRYEQIAQFDPAQNKVVSVPIDFGEAGEEVYLVLFGTGLRSRLALATVRATIGNEDIEILYAGSQGAYVGLDQINLKLPRTLAGKGEVDLKLYVEGKLANTVRINLK